MNKFLIVLAVLSLFIHSSMNRNVTDNINGECQIDPTNKSITIYNLKNNCNIAGLQGIFSNSKSGTFPNGTFKGYALACFGTPCEWGEILWKGKTIKYTGGVPPNDRGTVINSILSNILKLFEATIYRTNAPIDGKEAFAIDYKKDIFTFFVVDYIREVQKDLYLGIATIRGFETNPVAYFLLEADRSQNRLINLSLLK